MFALENE